MIKALGFAVQGLQQSSLNVAKAADRVSNPDRTSDLSNDLIDVKINENNFKANAQVIATTKDMQETLFDALGQNVDINA
jgi:hypothetical protein